MNQYVNVYLYMLLTATSWTDFLLFLSTTADDALLVVMRRPIIRVVWWLIVFIVVFIMCQLVMLGFRSSFYGRTALSRFLFPYQWHKALTPTLEFISIWYLCSESFQWMVLFCWVHCPRSSSRPALSSQTEDRKRKLHHDTRSVSIRAK